MRKYTAKVIFISGTEIIYPTFESKNKETAKLKVKLDRQRKGDEMFIRSVKVEGVKS